MHSNCRTALFYQCFCQDSWWKFYPHQTLDEMDLRANTWFVKVFHWWDRNSWCRDLVQLKSSSKNMFRKRTVQFQSNGKLRLKGMLYPATGCWEFNWAWCANQVQTSTHPTPLPGISQGSNSNRPGIKFPPPRDKVVFECYSIAGFVCQNAGAPSKEQSSSGVVKTWGPFLESPEKPYVKLTTACFGKQIF